MPSLSRAGSRNWSALLDPARPILHVAGALRIERYNAQPRGGLPIDDAARAGGSVLS